MEKGQLHGLTNVYLPDGVLWYRGDFVKGEMHGQGKVKLNDEKTFEGLFDRSLMSKGHICYGDTNLKIKVIFDVEKDFMELKTLEDQRFVESEVE